MLQLRYGKSARSVAYEHNLSSLRMSKLSILDFSRVMYFHVLQIARVYQWDKRNREWSEISSLKYLPWAQGPALRSHPNG